MNPTMRRGACPGLSAPMRAGDGLLVRLTLTGATIPLESFQGLCAAATAHGNGVMEITSRGNIQLRGLTAESAIGLTGKVALLGIEAADGVAVVSDPLAGLDPREAFDALPIAADLRAKLAKSSLAAQLSAKVSVVVDGGGDLHLDSLPADIRFRAVAGERVHVALGGDASASAGLGLIPREAIATSAIRLLEALADIAPQSRMRDAARGAQSSSFAAAIGDVIVAGPMPPARPAAADPIGVQNTGSGRAAVGVAPPFGHSDAQTFSRLIDAAHTAGAQGIRTAPGRAMLVVGVPTESVRTFLVHAAEIGFVVERGDARRRVIACAGAPICSSGEIPTRSLAPRVADVLRGKSFAGIVHLSGCLKSCAYPKQAPVAAFGRDRNCDVVVDGKPVDVVTVDSLPGRIAALIGSGGPWP